MPETGHKAWIFPFGGIFGLKKGIKSGSIEFLTVRKLIADRLHCRC